MAWGIINELHLWPDGRVPYRWGTPLLLDRRGFDGALKWLHEHTPFRFIETPGAVKQWLEIRGDPNTSAANFVGAQPYEGRASVRLGLYSSRRTVLHELAHVLGLQHEHQRSDRDQWVEVALWNFGIHAQHAGQPLPVDANNAILTAYDPISITHYWSPKTVRVKDPAFRWPGTAPDTFSVLDLEGLRRMYPALAWEGAPPPQPPEVIISAPGPAPEIEWTTDSTLEISPGGFQSIAKGGVYKINLAVTNPNSTRKLIVELRSRWE